MNSYLELGTHILENMLKRSGHRIPLSVNDLVGTVIRMKTSELEVDFYRENKYLPKSIMFKNLERKILQINRKLETWTKKYNFDRNQEIDYSSTYDNEDNEDDEETQTVIFGYCAGYLNNDEYEQYVNYEISTENLKIVKNWYRRKIGKKYEITLPKFDLITDYLSLLEFYDSLIQDFEDFNSVFEIKPPAQKYRFQSKLSEEQLLKLHSGLIRGGFIIPDSKKDEFLWSFGLGHENLDTNQITWIKSKSLAVYLIDTLFSFGFISDVTKMWAVGNRVFGIKNMAQIKQNYLTTNKLGKPKGYESIDDIISLL